MLNILEVCVSRLGFNLARLGPSDPMYWHLLIEAKKLAYADLNAYNGDPKFATIPGRTAVVRGPMRKRGAGKISPDKASSPPADRRVWMAGTIYLTTAGSLGQHGLADSQRVQRVRQPRDGAALRLRASQPRWFFLSEPASPNVGRAAQTAFSHTIIAGFVARDGQPLMTFGNMAGVCSRRPMRKHMVNLSITG
jgi:gamma-glutamyltranspeptidase/glutathione hydrolase